MANKPDAALALRTVSSLLTDAAKEVEAAIGARNLAEANYQAQRRNTFAFKEDYDTLKAVSERVAPWLSAALEDPAVCAGMKADINAWMEVLHRG